MESKAVTPKTSGATLKTSGATRKMGNSYDLLALQERSALNISAALKDSTLKSATAEKKLLHGHPKGY